MIDCKCIVRSEYFITRDIFSNSVIHERSFEIFTFERVTLLTHPYFLGQLVGQAIRPDYD